MSLQEKCLMVVNPAEKFQQWLLALINEIDAETHGSIKSKINDEILELPKLQADANCYIIPYLPPQETAAYLAEKCTFLMRNELKAWCDIEALWPPINFPQFTAYFNFDFYYDWMDLRENAGEKITHDIENILLLIKPTNEIKDFLITLMTNVLKISEDQAKQKIEKNTLSKGATIVITDITSTDDIEYFIDQHYEEIFNQQLLLWGGEDSRSFWPSNINLDLFKEWFSVDIHHHTFGM